MDIVRITSSFLLLVVGLTLAVCASPASVHVPNGPPTVRGAVVSVRHSATASGLVVEPGGGACGMQATLDVDTRVFRRASSGSLTRVSTGAIAEGDAVEVYAGGPVMESCPMQGRAAVVVIGAPAADLSFLVGRWVHSAEEDAGSVEVYRPEGGREFPPRMYRQQYAFESNGRGEALVPHPADAHYFAEATWSVDPARSDVVRVRYEGRLDVFRVVELRPDVLRIERLGA